MKPMKKLVSWMLVLVMVLSMCTVATAATRHTTATPSIKTEVSDGKIVATVSAKGDLQKFDFGISYNADQVTVEDVKWDTSWQVDYTSTKTGLITNGDRTAQEYVVLVGTCPNEYQYDGAIATITFVPKDGVKTVDSINVYADSAADMKESQADTLAEAEGTPKAQSGAIDVTNTSGDSDTDVELPTITGTGSVDAVIKDDKLVVTVSINDDLMDFDYGITYNADQLEVDSISWDADFYSTYCRGGLCDKRDISADEYVVIGGAYNGSFQWDGPVVSITFTVKEGVKKVDSLKVIQDSKKVMDATGAETLAEAGATPVTESGMILIAIKEVIREEITNEDGTTTEKVTEKETKEDGSTTEKVTETTVTTNGAVKEKVEEVVTDAEGNKTTTNKETVTNTDGSVKETEKTVTTENDELISILKELLQVTKDIYERLTVIEKELADGTKVIKELTESSKVDDDGNIVKETLVKDERKDKNGKGLEKFEYASDSLTDDIEWKTNKIEKEELKDDDKKPFDKKDVKDYEAYDIVPESNGEKVAVKKGSVKVSLPYKEEWKGKKVRAYDFEKDQWLDAEVDGDYVSFNAEHFSQYAIVATVNYTLGNVDSLDSIELKDAQLALRIALLLENDVTEEQELAADVDENGSVELKDAQQILRRALLLIDEFEKAEAE